MTRLLVLAGVLLLAGAVVVFWPFALLIAGLGLLLLAAVRNDNQRRAVRQ